MKRRVAAMLAFVVVLGLGRSADAQWVFLARTALGAIKPCTFTFTDGQQSASIRVASLSDNLCQLIALSDAKKDGTSAASMIVQGTLRICSQLGAQCSLSHD